LKQRAEDKLTADALHCGEDLIVWRSKHPLLGGAVETGGSFSLTSPALARTMVVTTASRPGMVWAASKATGAAVWSRSFPSVHSVLADRDLIYAKAGRQIVCINAANGETQWQTPPWPTEVDAEPDADLDIIRGPQLFEGLVLWPSAGGLVTCARADSGAEVWRSRRDNGVLSRLTCIDGKVIGTEQPAGIFALDVADGRPIWSRTLPTRSLHRPMAAFGGVLVRLDNGLLLLNSRTGETEVSWCWPGRLVGHFASGDGIAFAVLCEPEDSIVGGRHSVIPRECRIVRLAPDGATMWELESVIRGPRIAWSAHRRVLVEACGGVAICDVNNGRRIHLIHWPDFEWRLTPTLDADRIYVTTVEGEIFAFRFPA